MYIDICMLLHHALRTESAHEMLPLAHAVSEDSNEPAHPHSLARDITRWLCITHQRTPQQIRKKCGGGGDCFSMEVRTSFPSRKYMTTCNFPGGGGGGGGGGGLGPLPPLPLCLRPYQSFKQFEFTLVRHFRDFLCQRVLGRINCQAWSIHKPSANYIS